MKTYQNHLSILLTLIIAVSAITAAVPAGSAAETQTAQTSAYSIPNPIFSLKPAAKGVLVSWNTDSRVDHYRVYHKTGTGWNMIADNIKVGERIHKGDELGYFLFGGSDCVMLFSGKTGFSLSAKPASSDDTYANGYAKILCRAEYGRFVEKK